ncbi:sulfite exporter TauE/SafE family protein [Paracoccus contaminans]|uniref:sulfite exporter TauE/SafE family protein n=1 Tax=Paracoccus contaminans TaxID=1945662 RepID=UPI001469BB21|nr:sulfite exporter TauE/SafE family protein [Paracoccus contaminans]
MTDAGTGWTQLALFWALAALGGWTQTLTGFALGLLVMSGATLFHLLPVPATAQIISVLVLLNGAMVLARDHRHMDRRALWPAVAGALPTIALGYWLLQWMTGAAVDWLRLVLGLFIAAAAAQLARRPQPWQARSGRGAFAAAGATGGIMGGLFATSGPPVIWLFYRQPMTLDAVRVTLVSYFVITQAWRLLLSLSGQSMDRITVTALAGALPAIALGTLLARHAPPRVTPLTIRKAALALLFLSGVALVLTAASALLR